MILRGTELKGRSGHEAAWALLQAMYQEETGEKMPPICYADRGKPYFEGSPWHFSLTHTPRHAFAALSRTPIGIDAEERSRQLNPQLARRILSDSEYAQYMSAEDRNLCLLSFWVLKEAAAKRTGQGLTGFPNQTHFTLPSPHLHQLQGCLVAVFN